MTVRERSERATGDAVDTAPEEAVDTAPEDVVTEDVVDTAPEDAVTEDVVTEDVVTEDVVTEAVVTEAVVTEAVVTEDVVTEDVVTEDVVTEDVVDTAPEDAVTEDVVTEDVVTEDVVTEHVVGTATENAAGTVAVSASGPPEWLLVASGAVVLVAVMVSAVRGITGFWLPLDASRYVAEVEWLRGERELLPGIHPPAFPGLAWLFELVLDRWTAVLFAMVTAYVAFVIALYVLLRQWHRPAVAVAASSVAAVTPVLAEMLGWGGGANMLGMAASLFALAATEAWVRTRRRPWLVGVATGAAIASHPLSGMIAVFFVGARGGWCLVSSLLDRRRTGRARVDAESTGPDHVPGGVEAERAAGSGRPLRALQLVRTSTVSPVSEEVEAGRSSEPLQLTLAINPVDPGLLGPTERPDASDASDAASEDDEAVLAAHGRNRAQGSLLRRRGIASGGADTFRGWAVAVAASVPFAAASAGYYLGTKAPGQVGLGIPDLAVLLDLLAWAGREHLVVLLLHFVAIVTPLLLFGRPSHAAAALLGAVIVLGTSALTGDPSYRSRFVYLVPALLAITVAEFGPPLVAFTARRLRKPTRSIAIVMCGLSVVLMVQVAFHERLDTATRFYARVTLDDVALLETLQGRGGVTASSYWGTNEAEPTNWFVNAAASREAWSPIGPWLSSIPEEAEAGRQMQRLFAGQVGIEDGRFQVAASGTAAGHYELRVAVRVDGWYHSAFELDVARTDWPFAIIDAEASLEGDTLRLRLNGVADRDRIDLLADLTGDGVRITAETSSRRLNNWHVVLSPSSAGWGLERLGISQVRMDSVLGGRMHQYSVSADSTGAAARSSIYGPGQPVDFDVAGADRIEFRVAPIDGFGPRGDVVSFDEQRVSDDLDVQQVVVWRNTGLVERFDTPCYAQFGAATNVVGFERVAGCGSAPDGG